MSRCRRYVLNKFLGALNSVMSISAKNILSYLFLLQIIMQRHCRGNISCYKIYRYIYKEHAKNLLYNYMYGLHNASGHFAHLF